MTLHPILAAARLVTERWFQNRAKCQRCANYSRLESGSMQCAAAVGVGHFEKVCVTMRAEGGLCGPTAVLFKARGRRV